MKKKLFSRSLALGALMAFVITGSAFAAVEESGKIIADGESISKSFDVLHVTGEAYQNAVLGAGAFNNKLELDVNELKVESNGANSAVGVIVADGSAAISGSSISVSAVSANAAYGVIAEQGDITIGGVDSEVTITSAINRADDDETGMATSSTAVLSTYDADVIIGGGKINITAENDFGNAHAVGADGGKITVGGEATDVVIKAAGNSATGAYADYDASQIEITGALINVDVDAQNTVAVGLHGTDGGKIKLGDESGQVFISATVSGEGDYKEAYGVLTEGSEADVTIDGSAININAVTNAASADAISYAVKADESSVVTVGSNASEVALTAATSGMGQAQAVYAYKSDVALNGSVIKVNAVSEDGMALGVNAENGGEITVGSEAAQVAISASAGGERNDAYGVLSQALGEESASKVEIQGNAINIAASASDGNAYGTVALGDGSQLALGDGKGEVTISAQASGRTIGIYTEGSEAAVNADKLKIVAEGRETSSYGIMARSGSDVDIYAGTINVIANHTGLAAVGASSLALTGDTVVTADNAINVGGGAQLSINEDGKHSTVLQGNIVFGALEGGSSGDSTADVQIGLNGAASSWTGASVGGVQGFKLNINNGAAWNVTGDSVVNDLTLNGGVVNLQSGSAVVDSLQGSEGVVSVANAENKFTITGSSSIEKLTATTSQEYAEALASNDMAGAAQSVADQIVDANAAAKTAATSVYIPESSIVGAYTAEVNAAGEVINGREGLNSANAGIGNLAGLALMAWRAENNDMNKRLGELRASEGEHGVWVRMNRGESKYKGVKNQYNTYQIGYDEKLSADKRWMLGAAFSYTDGESGLGVGSGENKHKGLALYGSYLGDDGSFIDLIAKYARLEHDFDIRGGAGSGDYDTNGYSVSAEYGKRFTQENGVWLEPQVELTYGHVSGVNYFTDKRVNVRQDAMDSVVGRLGLSVGKNIERGNVYARASYLYDFDGDTSLRFSNEKVAREIGQDIGGGWWEVGVGANLRLGKDTHVYVDVERTYGGDVSTPWQWNAGLRYSF